MKNNELTAVKGKIPSLDGLPQPVIEYVMGLVAENVALRKSHPQPFGPEMMKAIDAFDACAESVPEQGMLNAFFILRDSIKLTTEQADAAIAEIGARAVGEFVSDLAGKIRLAGGEDGYSLVNYGEYADHLESKGEEFAANLRAGRKG